MAFTGSKAARYLIAARRACANEFLLVMAADMIRSIPFACPPRVDAADPGQGSHTDELHSPLDA
jgi:hypothetical protein